MDLDKQVAALAAVSSRHEEGLATLSEGLAEMSARQVAHQMAIGFLANILRSIDSDHYDERLGGYLAMLRDTLTRDDPDAALAGTVLETVQRVLQPQSEEDEE
ncbi:hypothetical protein [Methylobacterium gnaphalii]|uniref:Uncharacterized protein n=1 Tax=Methylobacterium gnaphalii TaxID=1010610 RepID=A0A512JK10_9HYPH|nr:hypothetical protein [Methylobacterium gnaphalii]GEP10297.1 hypothetical protein MGN01_21420 [Methylobacterium gnaphalii]GJD70954.1 hypothetical protein MMMDOFMJ_3908 [Methylobacterium gnaphalii]GLS49762.1 hypothetical protein GCM10007885_26120 [Methylobacterium gnaphalii]